MAKEWSFNNQLSIQEYLEEKNMQYDFDFSEGKFNMEVSTPSNLGNLHFKIELDSNARTNEDAYTVRAIPEVSADVNNQEQMLKLMEYFCRINNEIDNGNFIIDFESGAIGYKTYVNRGDELLSSITVASSIEYPIVMFDTWGPGIEHIIFYNVSVDEAMRKSFAKRMDFISLLKGLNDLS